MSNYVTIARPYAKAIFEHALAHEKLKNWSVALQSLALVVSQNDAIEFIHNPATLTDQQASFLMTFASETVDSSELPVLTHFVSLLADNKRLLALPSISYLFDQMRAEQEKTLTVDVVSYSPLSKQQESVLINKLKTRLKREVALNISIDQALMGGAIIQAGDLVIDGSVRGELNKLRASLVA